MSEVNCKRMPIVCILILCISLMAGAAGNQSDKDIDFLGRWEIMLDATETQSTKNSCWLEISKKDKGLDARMLWRWGSPLDVDSAQVRDGELELVQTQNHENKPYSVIYRARIEYGHIVGLVTYPWDGSRHHFWGRPWKGDSSGQGEKWGEPVDLFNGIDLSNWRLRNPAVQSKWYVEDGVMTNIVKDVNLVTEQVFDDFKLEVEFKLDKGSNSGVYLRGRYEVSLLEDYNRPPTLTGNGAIYGRIQPTENASKPAGEWQKFEATLIGRQVTVVLNGKKIIDNQIIEGITGGALSSAESTPGPILIQGDHGKVYFRKIRLTPLLHE